MAFGSAPKAIQTLENTYRKRSGRYFRNSWSVTIVRVEEDGKGLRFSLTRVGAWHVDVVAVTAV